MARIGRWLTLVSLALLVLSVAPIKLYAMFGPADGNPVGLGLLMVFGGALFGATLVMGSLVWLVGLLIGCRGQQPPRGDA